MSDAPVVVTAVMHFTGAIDAEIRAALDRLVAAVRAEDGCLEYAAHVRRDAPDAGEVLMIERWRDAAALDVHGASPHLLAFRKSLAGRIAAPSDVIRWRGLD
jgi:quinol monooxygenase YgiN